MLVLLCNRYHETEICRYELILCTFTVRTSFLDHLCEFDFLINTDKRCTTNFYEILIQSFAGTVGDTLLNL